MKSADTTDLSHYPELLQILFRNRGITTHADADKFLHPSYESLNDPFLFPDMEKACVRIYEAVEAREKVIIYGDYDCDGIPGSVVLHDFFKKIGYENFEVYIPDRHGEGYGLHADAVRSLNEAGAKLIITVDLGTTAVDEVAQAGGFGIDVIITDHHIPPEVLPRGYAILNPKIGNYPYGMLCGSGVAFKLVQGLVKKYGEYWKISAGWEKWLLDMAGLGTLSDMVPLREENRVLAYFGIKVLQKSPRPGLQKLLKKMDIDQRYLAEDDITFMITPRINAASRMDVPMRAFELLATTDVVEAGVLADHLAKINDERKIMVATIMKEVHGTLEKREEKGLIVIGNPKWRAGILGLVAGKITDTYKKPAFVWGCEGSDTIKGSCRSIEGVNMVAIMRALPENALLSFGGHELAGGFSVTHEQIHFLEDHLLFALSQISNSDSEIQEVEKYEAELTLDDITIRNWQLISSLAPFGIENPKPVFHFSNIVVLNIKHFGKEKNHLALSFKDSTGKIVKAIAFFKTSADYPAQIEVDQKINLLASFDLSRFAGRVELRLRIVDII
ncbi:MAG: single-stranded-DNA-specific exonuclease RecJ [Candidatus Paceibacterota bacterium]